MSYTTKLYLMTYVNYDVDVCNDLWRTLSSPCTKVPWLLAWNKIPWLFPVHKCSPWIFEVSGNPYIYNGTWICLYLLKVLEGSNRHEFQLYGCDTADYITTQCADMIYRVGKGKTEVINQTRHKVTNIQMCRDLASEKYKSGLGNHLNHQASTILLLVCGTSDNKYHSSLGFIASYNSCNSIAMDAYLLLALYQNWQKTDGMHGIINSILCVTS